MTKKKKEIKLSQRFLDIEKIPMSPTEQIVHKQLEELQKNQEEIKNLKILYETS